MPRHRTCQSAAVTSSSSGDDDEHDDGSSNEGDDNIDDIIDESSRVSSSAPPCTSTTIRRPRGVTTEEIHDSLDYHALRDVEQKIKQFIFSVQYLSGTGTVDVVGSLLCAKRKYIALSDNSSTYEYAAIHRWAADRYDLDPEYYRERGKKKPWLRKMTSTQRERDAAKTLGLLIDNGADPYDVSSEGQTPLHLCMANGFANGVLALLTNEKVKYTLKHLNKFDWKGDSPLSAALEAGHYECVSIFLQNYPLDDAVYVMDQAGNNIVGQLCQYCSVDYHADDFDPDTLATDLSSTTIHHLRRVLDFVQKNEMVDVLMHKNRYGENCLHVAARCGNYLEVKAILEVDFGRGRSIADCWSEELQMSPMQCAENTLRMVNQHASVDAFDAAHIYNLGPAIEEDRNLTNWTDQSIQPLLELFEERHKPKKASLDSIVMSRPGSEAACGQRYPPGENLVSNFKKSRKRRKKTIKPGIRSEENPKWTFLNGSSNRARALRKQIEAICNVETDVPADRNKYGVVRSVAPFQLRNPLHPCLKRQCYPLSQQFGLFATADIPADTVIGEYSGEIYREGSNNSDFGATPEYGMEIKSLDTYVANERPGGKDGVYLLDARRRFNETALVNDANLDFMSNEHHQEDDDAVTPKANIEYVEILVDGFPRIFLITTIDIPDGAELLTEYGVAYWDRIRNYALSRQGRAMRHTARRKLRENGPDGDFVCDTLELGQLQHLRWNKTSGMPQTIVAPHVYRVGTGTMFSKNLLEFCKKKGITTRARCLTIGGGTLESGKDELATLNGSKWYCQRHSCYDQSDLQWISPADDSAYQEVLAALSNAGFDFILESIGKHLGLEGLTVYQVSFICVSKCYHGRDHYDMTATAGKAFNIIVPLILAQNTSPELEVKQEGNTQVGDYRYSLSSGIMLGDDVYHATGEVNYTREFRLAISIYVADIDESNVDAIKENLTVLYCPGGDDLLSLAGMHWSKRNPSARLPKPVCKKRRGGDTGGISSAGLKKKRGDAAILVFSGRPNDDLGDGFSWPDGWQKETFERTRGLTKGHQDSYWYSPKKTHRLRSMAEVRKFLCLLSESNGDEDKAYAALCR